MRSWKNGSTSIILSYASAWASFRALKASGMLVSKKLGSMVFTIYRRSRRRNWAHVEQVLAVDRLLDTVVRDVLADARVLQSQLVDPCGAELGEVRHVHLLDVTVEDELQRHTSKRDWKRHGLAYLLAATHQLLHEEDGALLR